MGCQKSIAREIIAKKADYVLALKGNHEIAHEEISRYLDDLVLEKKKVRERPETLPDAARLLQNHSVTEKTTTD